MRVPLPIAARYAYAMPYNHTQVGWLIVAIGAAADAIAVISIVAAGLAWVAIFPVVATLLVFALFGSLKTSVDTTHFRLAFGVGLVHRSWQVEEIRRAEAVRNPWWLGWGIRFMPGRVVFNVSGFDAVEIETRAGKVYRVGTDDARGLLTALQSVAPLE
jgi:hypothetical protein